MKKFSVTSSRKYLMQYRILGNTGLKVSCIGYGCMGLTQSYPPYLPKNESRSGPAIHSQGAAKVSRSNWVKTRFFMR